MQCVAANIDLTIIESGTFDKTFQWKTGDPPISVDLLGFDAHMQIRPKIKSDDILLDLSFQDKEWIADGDTGIYLPNVLEVDKGKYRIYIKDEDTSGLCPDHKQINAVYDLFLINSYGESVLKQWGNAIIIPDVTRNV